MIEGTGTIVTTSNQVLERSAITAPTCSVCPSAGKVQATGPVLAGGTVSAYLLCGCGLGAGGRGSTRSCAVEGAAACLFRADVTPVCPLPRGQSLTVSRAPAQYELCTPFRWYLHNWKVARRRTSRASHWVGQETDQQDGPLRLVSDVNSLP